MVSDEELAQAIRTLNEYQESDEIKIARLKHKDITNQLWFLGLLILGASGLLLWAVVDLVNPAQAVIHCSYTIINGVKASICQ